MRGLVLPHKGVMPRIAADVFIAPGAIVIGDVEIGPGSSIWYNTVIRGDVHYIRIGSGTNIQDGTVIHVSGGSHPTVIGDDVLIGHQCMIHGCTLQSGSFIGMGATILDGVTVETGGQVAAHALVPPRKIVKAGQLWGGNPAVFMRDLRPEDIARIPRATANYRENAKAHMDSLDAFSASK